MSDVTRTIEIQVLSKDAEKNIDNLNKSLDENQKEVKDTTKDTEKYNKTIDETSKATSGLVGYLDKITGGMISSARSILGSVKALKSFKIALAATGLGAIVVVLGSVITAFTRLEGPMRKLDELMGGLGAAIDIAIDRFGFLGMAMSDLLTGDLSGALSNWKATWEGISEEMGKAFDLGVLLSRQIRENSVNESARNAIIAKNNRLIIEARTNAVSETLTLKERLAAATEWERLNRENIELAKKNAEEALTIAKNQYELSPAGPTGRKTVEATIAFNNAITQYNNTIASQESQQIRLQTRKNQLLNVQKRETKEITEALRDQTEAIEGQTAKLGELIRKSVESQLEVPEAIDKINIQAIESTEDQIKTQLDLDTVLQESTNAATVLLDVFQGKVKGKDIFKTVLKSITSIIGLIPGIGTGVGLVGNLIGGLFADGGLINGPSHKQGGVWINAEGGEGVIKKESMAIPWVRDLASQIKRINRRG
jgi:tellurite resistance protein